MLGVRLEVADVRLGVAAGSVQQHQRGFARIAGVQVAGAHSAGIQITLRERNALQIAPDAFELRHPVAPILGDNGILAFCKRYV